MCRREDNINDNSKKYDMIVRIGFSWLMIGSAGSCEYCNGPLDAVRNGKNFDRPNDCQLVKQECTAWN
jgi:hypothetical protein